MKSLESFEVYLPKHEIEADLDAFGPNVSVVGSRMTEDGYELVLEGDAEEINALIGVWTEANLKVWGEDTL